MIRNTCLMYFYSLKLKSVWEINNENTINWKWFCGYNCKEKRVGKFALYVFHESHVNEMSILNFRYKCKCRPLIIIMIWWTRITIFYCFLSPMTVDLIHRYICTKWYKSLLVTTEMWMCRHFWMRKSKKYCRVYLSIW